MASKIDLISNALILIGDLPITSLTGNSRAQVVANNLYDNVVQNELTKYRWGFARKKAQLGKEATAIVGTEWNAKYTLPSDLLTLIKLNPNQPYQIIEDKGLKQITDSVAIEGLIDEVIAANPDQVEQFRAGKEKVLGFFVGQIMKQSKGKANPGQVNQMLREKLK